MSLEAQLLKIIEEQQLQLKQQQQEQQKALELIQVQSATINGLNQFTKTLNEKHNEAVQIVKKYQQITQELSEQTISATFSQDVQQNLKVQLQTRLNDLVQNLQIDNQVKNQVSKIIPQAVELEINSQLKPLAEQITARMSSVEQYQQKLAELIQQISSRL